MKDTYKFWCNYLKINQFIYSDEKKIKFLHFCEENQIKYLSEINSELLKKYSQEPGVGVGKIADIEFDLANIHKRLSKQQKFEKIMNCQLKKIIFGIKNLNNITVGEFLNFNEKELEALELKSDEIERIYEVCTSTLPLNEILRKIGKQINEDDMKLLVDRLGNNKTLEEIGAYRNISRERIRQIETKYKHLIGTMFKNSNLNIALKIESDFKDEISMQEMCDLFGKKYTFLINILKKNELFSRPFYIDFLDLFLFDRRERFFKIFYSLDFSNILTTKNVETIRENFKNFKWITQDEIEKIITKLGYEKHGKYYILHNGYKDILELYFVKLLKEPIRVDESTVKEIIEDINSRLNYNLYSTEIQDMDESMAMNLARRLEGLLSRIDGIVMTDSRTYIHINKIEYDIDKFLELKDTILSVNEKYIDTITMYKNFEESLNSIGIYSEYLFYSLFKYHFAQELHLSTNGNSRVLTIGDIEFNRVDELENLIKVEGKILEKSYIQEKLNYSNASLNNAIDNSNKIISYDRSFIGIIDFLNISENELLLFKKLVSDNEENGHIFIPDLISKIKLNKKFKLFIEKNSINNYFIASLVRYYFPEYKGGCNLLSRKI